MSSLLLLLSLLPAVHGSAVQEFGAGAATIGAGGGGVAVSRDGSVVFLNPAALVDVPGDHSFLVGYAAVRSRFLAFPDLYWDTNQDGRITADDPPLEMQPDYAHGDGLQVSTHQKIGKRFALGISIFLPRERILQLSTFEPSLPTYFMYDSRLQTYALALGAGYEFAPGFSFGLGCHVIPQAIYNISMTVDATVTGADGDENDVADLISAMRVDVNTMGLDLKLGAAPLVGFRWDVGELIPPMHGLAIAGSWRGSSGLPVAVTGDVQGNFSLEDLGDIGPVMIPVVAKLGLGVIDHYLPEQLVVGASYMPVEYAEAYFDSRWTRWADMQVNIAQVVESSIESPLWNVDESLIEDGNTALPTWRDTWSFRAGGELHSPKIPVGAGFEYLRFHLRGGGGVEPTPLVSQTVDSALLDSDRLVVGAGLGIEHQDPFDLLGTQRWDAFCQVHKLAEGPYQRVASDPPLAGQPIETVGDVTTIPVGGKIWTIGGQWSFEY